MIALYTQSTCRVFHLCNLDDNWVEKVRVIYLDCNSHPGLLDDGEWEYYIETNIKDVAELSVTDTRRTQIIEQKDIKHKVYMRLGY